MNILPVSRTVTDIVVNLTEDEAREALHSPEHLQTAIRKVFADLRRKNDNGKVNIVLGKSKKVPKGLKERKQIERVPCQDCGVMIAAYKQGKHKCAARDAK